MSAIEVRLDEQGRATTFAAHALCVWALNRDLTTLFASPGFARLVGINRLVLAEVPWFALLSRASLSSLEWLIDTQFDGATTVLELRHIEGRHIAVVVRRVYGGPATDKAVFIVASLSQALAHPMRVEGSGAET